MKLINNHGNSAWRTEKLIILRKWDKLCKEYKKRPGSES